MGAIQMYCRDCGSTFVRGRCDCPIQTGPVIDMIECQYCGTHMARAEATQHDCQAALKRIPLHDR